MEKSQVRLCAKISKCDLLNKWRVAVSDRKFHLFLLPHIGLYIPILI